MPATWWLLIRKLDSGPILQREAIGIAEYVDPEVYGPGTEYISKTDHWIATKHDKLTEQLGSGWMFEVISRAEFETYRDLHGLEMLGE